MMLHLQSDLAKLSGDRNMAPGVMSTFTARSVRNIWTSYSAMIAWHLHRSKGWVTQAAKQLALPPNQKG